MLGRSPGILELLPMLGAQLSQTMGSHENTGLCDHLPWSADQPQDFCPTLGTPGLLLFFYNSLLKTSTCLFKRHFLPIKWETSPVNTGLNEVPPHAEPSTELNKGQLYL